MTYEIKPLSCDPKKLKGLSERLIVSHWENNYRGAVKRLNAITAQLATLDFGTTPGFELNGLKREELIASDSMILHELYFGGLGAKGEADREHSYHLDYGAAAAKYVDAFMKNIRWDHVSRLHQQYAG
jgi:superoxide dismutase, Fe-Mn family